MSWNSSYGNWVGCGPTRMFSLREACELFQWLSSHCSVNKPFPSFYHKTFFVLWPDFINCLKINLRYFIQHKDRVIPCSRPVIRQARSSLEPPTVWVSGSLFLKHSPLGHQHCCPCSPSFDTVPHVPHGSFSSCLTVDVPSRSKLNLLLVQLINSITISNPDLSPEFQFYYPFP